MVTLTDDQHRALASRPDEPLRLVDPVDNRAYVLLPTEVYERLQERAGDTVPADVYPALDRAFAEGWNDSKMDDYDRYEDVKK